MLEKTYQLQKYEKYEREHCVGIVIFHLFSIRSFPFYEWMYITGYYQYVNIHVNICCIFVFSLMRTQHEVIVGTFLVINSFNLTASQKESCYLHFSEIRQKINIIFKVIYYTFLIIYIKIHPYIICKSNSNAGFLHYRRYLTEIL